MVKGEFERRKYSKADIDSLIHSRWNETFVNSEDIDEMRKEFPIETALSQAITMIERHFPKEHSFSKRYIIHQLCKVIDVRKKWFGDKEVEK